MKFILGGVRAGRSRYEIPFLTQFFPKISRGTFTPLGNKVAPPLAASTRIVKDYDSKAYKIVNLHSFQNLFLKIIFSNGFKKQLSNKVLVTQ